MAVLLQLEPPAIPDWAVLLSQGLGVLTALIGLFIAYQAYRGYRRNDSRPMLFISVGFVLAVGFPFVMAVPTLLLGDAPVIVATLTVLSDVSAVVGLLCILYALRMPT